MDSKAAFELAELDALAQGALVARGDATASELLEAALLRAEAGRGLNAIITDLSGRARTQAAELDTTGAARRGELGPFAGVPFLLKDLGASLAGAPERMGSRALAGYVATESAWIVERWLAAGLVPFGKTNTPEWGNHCTTEPSLFGPTANPWGASITPGGSSGGSAAAVAAGIVPAASGGDGTGSIRVPASCCGLVGLKPRRGRTSFAPGAGHILEGLVNEHVLTRTVRDCAGLLDVVAAADPGDPYSAPAPGDSFLGAVQAVSEGAASAPLTIRVSAASPFPGGLPTGPAVAGAVDAVAATLASAGHTLVEGGPTIDADAVANAITVLHQVSNVGLLRLATEVLGRPPLEEELEASSWVMVREGLAVSGEAYADAITAIHAQTRRFVAEMQDADVLLVPTLVTTAPPYALLDQPRGSTRAFFDVEFATTGWTSLANVTGWAAISLPLGEAPDGSPIGVQFMAADERPLLELAAFLEQTMPWAGRRPAGWVGAA
ncbi:MAG: amidase [Solirubrobacteraceae bacterium]|nr:amidase [Solirubrobacteraceae bacterium]